MTRLLIFGWGAVNGFVLGLAVTVYVLGRAIYRDKTRQRDERRPA